MTFYVLEKERSFYENVFFKLAEINYYDIMRITRI